MESFSAAIVPQMPRLLALARRVSGEPEDLVQETVARALRFRSSFREGSDLRAWLTRILFNLHFGERRRSLRYQRARAAFAREPRAQPVEPIVAAELAEACPRLCAGDLRLIARAEVEGASYAELAEEMAIPIGTVMSRLFRARRRVASAAAQAQRTPVTSSSPAGRPSSRTTPRSSARSTTVTPSGRVSRAA